MLRIIPILQLMFLELNNCSREIFDCDCSRRKGWGNTIFLICRDFMGEK